MTETRARPASDEAQENPLLEGLLMRRTAEPCILTIFGGSGDLTQRKLFPALYALAVRHLLPEHFGVLGVARSEMPTEDFVSRMRDAVGEHCATSSRQEIWETLAAGFRHIATDFSDDAGWDSVAECLDELDEDRGAHGNRLYYLAVPRRPSRRSSRARQAPRERGLDAPGRREAVRPRPRPARELNDTICAPLQRGEVFRIDHYLGKETVQNLLALRFANGIFEPIWNRQFVDHVQITVAESIGDRGTGRASTSRRARSATSSRTTCCSSSR